MRSGPYDDIDGLLRQIVDAIPGGVIRVSLTGAVVAGNREAVRFLGTEIETLSTLSLEDFEPSTIREDGTPFPASEYPVVLALKTGKPAGPATLGIRRPDGTVGWAVFRAVPIFDSTGVLDGAVATFLDITERKEAELALLASESRWRSLVQAIPDFVMVADKDMQIRSINRTTPPFEEPTTLGTLTLSYIDPAYRDEWERCFRQALEKQATSRLETRGMGENGNMVWYESVFVPAMDPTGAANVLVVARETTERRQMLANLAEKERLASVGMVASSVAHEVMNPLTYVLANLDVLRSERAVDEERRKSALDRAYEGAMRMRQIVWDLRSLGRAGAEELLYVDVRSVVETAIRLAGISERKAIVEIDLDGIPGVVANESRLCQVFMNLLLNAAQAMEGRPPSERVVRVTARRGREGSFVGIALRDAGVGVAEAQISRMFDAFYTTKSSGTGLGLSISLDLVTRMGGRIEVESSLGEGSTFVVWLPEGRRSVDT